MRPWMISALAFAMATPAFGAPAATQEQADKLKAVFERYLGRSIEGEPSKVTIVPEGTAYRMTYDYKQLGRPLESFGMTIDSVSQSVLLAPNDDGTWRVTSDAMPPMVFHFKDQTITMSTSTYKFDGVFDPKLGVFTDQTATQDGSIYDQDAPAMLQHRRTGRSVLTETATSAGASGVNLDVRYALTDITAEMTGRSPPNAATGDAPPPFSLSYQLPKAGLGVRIDGLLATRLLDLWAFFVAHPSHDAIVAGQEELRGLLLAALPLPLSLKEDSAAEGLTAKTPLGDVTARSIAAGLELAGLPGTGTVNFSIAADGLGVPTTDLPAWMAGFLPTALDIRPSITGFHAEEAAKEAVADFDLNSADGFRPEQRDKIAHIFWPGDGKLMLAPSRITSAVLDLKLEGEATLTAAPSGRFTIAASGVDKAIALLQAAAGSDPTAAQALTGLVTAKNLAKPNPDGTLGWVIEAAGNNAVTINGVPLK